MGTPAAIDDLPGYRRRFVVTPRAGWVRAELEDDYHAMQVTLHHSAGIVTAIDADMLRTPWTTCPGAQARLVETFAGLTLADFATRGAKPHNCTHLHDLATLAAVHAADPRPTVYDVLTSDPVDGVGRAVLRRDGITLFDWTLEGFHITAPADVAGLELMRLGSLLERLDAAGREAAKILRWGIMVGSGRAIPMAAQSDATKMPPSCFTFQPDMAARAVRVGEIRDFSRAGQAPLGGRTEAITENEIV